MKITHYLDDDRELFLKYRTGEWLGLKEAILGSYIIRDFKACTDLTAVAISIKKIMNKFATPDILKEIIKILASFSEVEEEGKLSKIAYKNEEYLLKVLEENNYMLTYSNQRDFSDTLNIKPRTFQRIVKNLVDKKLLIREKKRIYVSNMDSFKRYTENLKLLR